MSDDDRRPSARTEATTGGSVAAGSTAALACLFVHAGLFVLTAMMALLTAARPLAGPFDAASFFPILIVLIAGATRTRVGVAGGRPLLLAADVAIAGLLGATVASTPSAFLSSSPAWYVAGMGLAVVAAVVAFSLPAGGRGRIRRQPRDRLLLIALIVVDVAVNAWSVTSSLAGARVDPGPYLLQAVARTAPFDVAVLAGWWWGLRWPLGMTAIVSLAVVLASAVAGFAEPVRLAIAVASDAFTLGVAIVGPRLELPVAGPQASGRGAIEGTGGAVARSRPIDVWLAIAGLTWLPFVVFGSFPLVLDACFECGPRFPGDTLLWAAGLVTIPVVLGAALFAEAFGAARPSSLRPAYLMLLVAAAIVLLEIAAGGFGVFRFAFMTVAAPSAVLLAIATSVGLVRPAGLEGAGVVVALGTAGLVFAWTWGARATFGVPSIIDGTFLVASLAQAGVSAILLAAESARVRSRLGVDDEPLVEEPA